MNDKLQQLYNLYKDNGLITIDFNTFATANDMQRKGLYDLGVQQGLFSTTSYDTFSSAFSGIQPQQQPQQQQKRELPRMPKPGELANIGKEDQNATFDSQGNYHPENAVPASLRPLSQKVAADREAKKKEEERIFRQEQIAKVNQQREADQLASQFDLSAQQSLVESTARQQQEASSSASQRYEAAAEKFPILRNELLKDVYQQLQKEQDLPDFVKNQLENITPDLINLGEYGPGMSSGLAMLAMASPLAVASGAMSQNVAGLSVEEAVVPKMNYMFGPLGFTFEESGMTGDYMIVTAPNKDKIEISLNNFTQSSNQEEAKKLKNFIATNSTKIPQIEKIAAQYAGSNAKISSEKDVDNAISKVNNEYNALNADAETLTKDINVFENELNAFNSTPAALRNTPEYIEKKNLLDATLLDINKRRQDLIAKNSQIQANQAMVEKSVGKYADMKAQQGTWTGATYTWLGEGVSTALTGLLSASLDLTTLGGTMPTMPYYTEEMYRKGKKENLTAVREGIQGTILDPNTTVEWRNLAEESFWGGAYASLVKSAPAMAAPGGWVGRTAAFFGQSTDAVNQEMDNNPEFENISTSERLLVTVPIGIANAVLEEVGLSNLIKNKGFVSGLVTKAMSKAGVNTTETALAKIIKNDVESMLARGTLTLAGAGLAEAETGALQQVGEYAVKDIYNMAKEKEMFDTPDSLKEYALDVLKAGAQEAVGGMIMGTYPAAAAAYRKRGFEGMSNDEFKTFEATANDGMMQSAYISTLKTKVASGDMTMAEAKEELNDYRRSVGVYRSVDTELSTEDKKKAMNLISEKNALTQQIEGKDEAIVSRQKNRIAEINTQLNKLSENAVQEQATSEVPVQSETTISEEVEGGKPTTEPQVTTEEVKEEEVVPVLRTTESTTTALESLPEGERTNITFMQEDGTELPIMGNETMLAELFQQAQAVPVDERTEFHESVIDAVNVALSDQIEEEQVQMQEQESNPFENIAQDNEQIVFEADNLEDIPEQFRGGAVESGPQEITARKKILGLPVGRKEVVKRKGTTFKFVVTGAEAKANANLLSPLFDNGKIRYDRTLERKARGASQDAIARNVVQSISKTFPNMKVTNFKNAEEMKAYAEKFGRMSNQIVGGIGGVFVSGKDGQLEILINDEAADVTTLPHEVWHAILTKAFGDNEALFKKFRDSINNTLRKNGYNEIANELDAFSSSPEYQASETQGEEWLAQLGSLLTASGMTIDNITPEGRTLLEQIKKIFNQIANEIIGQPIFLEDATAEDVLDFMVTMSDRMSRGEDISSFFKDVDKKSAETGESRLSLQIGRKKKEEYAAKLAKERPDLEAGDLTADTISLVEKFGEENSKDGMGNPKLEKLAIHWIGTNSIILPEDGYKVVEAEKLATKNKIDPFAFSNPLDIIDKYQGTIKEKNINLDTIKEFSNKRTIPGTNVTVYDVEDTKEGQAAVRRVADAHWGKNWNGWCLISRKNGNLDQAWKLWSENYGKTKKKIAFENGKIISFQASGRKEEAWWDKRNDKFPAVPIREYIKNEKNDKEYLVRSTSENGDVIAEKTFKFTPQEQSQVNGNGIMIFQKLNDNNGDAISEKKWEDNGDLQSVKYFNQKGSDGTVFISFEDNTISNINTDYNGTIDIIENTDLDNHKIFDPNGNLEVDISTEINEESINPTKITTVSFFDKDGNLVNQARREVIYNEDGTGAANAKISRVIDENGVIRREFKYENDSENYNYYGTISSDTSWYSNGVKKGELLKFIYGNEAGNQSEKRVYDKEGNLIEETFEPVPEFDPNNVNFDFQLSGRGGTLQEVQRIAQRYNVNNQGFAPAQVNEFAMSRELEPYGYSAKRAAPEPSGRQRGVYIVNPKGRFFNPFKGKFQRVGTGAAALKESLKTIPGYDLMIEKAKNVALRTSRRYGADYDRIMNAVMEYVKGSKVYELANDSQREQMVRDVRAEFGKKEKSAPSPTKVFELPSVIDLFGPIEDVKMITMSEAELLKQQIRLLTRGAKDAKMSWMAISKQVAKQIKELVIAGKISNRQAASVISRMAMVNMFNQDSVDKFVDYMTKVFNDANYDKKINDARKRLPRALKNIKKKIGVANAVAPSLFQLFSINPSLIPDSVLERYLELVEMFGSSDSVLKLDNVSVVAQDVKKILDAVNEEVSQSEELALRFEDFANKVYDEDGNLDYAKTLAKMVDTDAITNAEAEIMRKYKKNILPKVEEPAKTEAEIEEEKKAIIKAIKATTINVSELPTRLERDLANRLVELLNPKYLKNLSVNQLENVMKLIDNINNGYLPRYAMITVEKLNSIKQASENLVPAVETAKPLKFSQLVGKVKSKFIKGTTASLQMIRRTPLAYIDQIFGDFNTKRIFNSVFEGMAKGHAAFSTDMNKVNKRLDDAHQAVAKSHGYNANDTLEASFRMMAYMIQREYESNPGSDQVNPAARFIEATLNKIYDGESKYKEADAKLLENILKKYGVNVGTDKKGNPIREIDINKLYKSFNTAERNALKTIREINDGLTDKAEYTASVIRGESITPLNNYVHLPIMHDYNPNERSTGIQNSDVYNNSRKPSTKAKTLEGRSGEVSAINFDVFASAQKGAKATLLDFHLTEPIRTSRKTINEARKMLKESGEFKGQNRELINAIDDANEEVIRNVLTNNFITDTDIEAVANEISKQGYRAILASSERFTSELASNMAFAMISDPKSFVAGTKYKSVIMSPMAVDIMFNVGSKQTKRLFSADNLSGRFIDTSILGQASGVKSVTSKGAISNVANIIYNKSLKKYKNRIELIADALISTPDKLVMRPVWFGAFANEFKNQTGEEIDFDKIGVNDEAYMNKYSDAISKARDFADEKSVLAGASDNPFMGIIKGTNAADQGYIKRAYNNFNNFMTRFAIYEFAAARQGIYAAMGNGTLSKREGYALLAGVATRMTTYTLLTKILGGVVLSLFGIEDEDEETENSFMQKFGQALASTATSLIIGRDFGNAVKTISNFGVEKINEEFFTDLRNGEYDPYEDAISYSSVPKGRPGNPVDLGDIALMFTGSFTPFAKTIDLATRKAFEDPKKEPAAIERQKNEILVRLPIEVLGNMGLIPMYKDVKNVVTGSIYEGLKKEMKAEKDKSKKEETKKKKTRRSGRSSRRGSRTGSR